MRYGQVVEGRFLSRPNRFIAHVEIEGKQETVHVKNTGRCRELLVPGARIYLEKSDKPDRKTQYDLISVIKNGRLINMDSQAPNKAVEEWLSLRELFPGLVSVRPETKFGNSRFDFYIETDQDKIFMEVKGVTLEENGVVSFPDAVSQRAVKHVNELIQAKEEGFQVYVMFVVQMEDVLFFTPNRKTQPEFADALIRASQAGVKLLAYDCAVTAQEMRIRKPVEVKLDYDPDQQNIILEKNLPGLKTSFRFGSLEQIPKPLLSWYDINRRILPWRESPTPYRVWVSEIMLQQTRVEAVKPYFERFMEALPDIAALAAAQEEVLLKLWEGLGYYNRVRNLQAAARQVMEDYGGSMPDTYEELLKLKGIGSYTAGAVASIAYGRPVPAVDGNVLRVVSRIRKDQGLITDPKVRSNVERDLAAVIPGDRPGDFNQAMMEIGACVCIPSGAPHCSDCPLEAICMAHRDGRELEYPVKARKKPRSVEEKTVLIIRDENKAALHRRPGRGLLAGMYEFPSLDGFCTAKEVVSYLEENGLKTLRIQPLEEAKHIFTHKEWHMRGFMVRVDELEPRKQGPDAKDWIYVEPQRTEDAYPVPSAFAAYMKYLNIRLGNDKFNP